MAKRLYVGNLSYNTTKAQLEEIFGKLGTVTSANLITDKFSGQSKGFAFVEMATEEEAQKAIKELHDMEVDGRKMVVNEARPQEDRNSGGFSGGPRRDNFSRNNNKRW